MGARVAGLIFVDALLPVAALFAAPLAWIHRVGLGPDGAASHGFPLFGRAFMTFRVDPVNLPLSLVRVVLAVSTSRTNPGRNSFVSAIGPQLMFMLVSAFSLIIVGFLMD